MKVLYSALVLAAVVLTSCKGELEPQESSVVSETANESTAPAVTTTQPNAVTPAQGATQTLAQGVNPAHGQPGHRCDVAVGAPLTKTGATPTTPITSTQQVTSQMLNSPAPAASQPVKTAPGMNPPHGQPGHRCDVAVGASLSSAPKPAGNTNQATITPATMNSNGTVTQGSGTTITTTNSNNATPALLKAPSTNATSGTNPPHGEPGHVCAQ